MPQEEGESTVAQKGRDGVTSLILSALQEGRRSLLEFEADRVAEEYGIKVAEAALAKSEGEAEAAAGRLGFPLALKVVSKDVIHKSDVGGVKVGIGSKDEARMAYAEILGNVRKAVPEAEVSGVLVQRMAPPGTEFVIGATRDPQFGPAVMFGLGGIYIELFKDVSFRLAPLTQAEAVGMIRGTKSYRLMAGYRGSKPLDMDGTARSIVAVGDLMADHPEVESVDINPIFAYPAGVMAVDVRIILKAP